MSPFHFSYGLTLLLLLIQCAAADGISPADRAFFESKIRPILVEHCYECHADGAEELGGKLLLDSREGMLKGGETGPSIVSGDPAASLLIQALKYESVEMPPDRPLPEAVINDFIKWIQSGAPDPRNSNSPPGQGDLEKYEADALWSFAPRQHVNVPEVSDAGWPFSPIDHLILAKLQAANIEPTHAADARTLIRRLSFDLTGLPPTIAEVEQFVAECKFDSAQALEDLVDSLLARPQFGEHWGRHWLDVARYGESNGDDGLGRNATFPHAWKYRDYVIDAFNRGVPYDRFITEQIAGDLLPAENVEQRHRQLIATGFLAIGSKPAAAMNNNFAMDIVDDQINVVGSGILGLSIACARCHDHKHDPIPTRDYYALAGIFGSTETLYGLAGNEKLTAPPTALLELLSQWPVPGSSRRETPQFASSYSEAIQELQPAIYESLAEPPRSIQSESSEIFSPENYAATGEHLLRGVLPSKETSYSISLWFRNTTNINERPITAYLFSRAKIGDQQIPGDHVGIGGKYDAKQTGKLFVFNGNVAKQILAGSTLVPENTWNHLVFVREGDSIRLFLNGGERPEIDGKLDATFGAAIDFSLGMRSERFAPLAGNLAHFALFPRALSATESQRLYTASGQLPSPQTVGLAMGVREKAKPQDCKIHINGEGTKLGPSVARGVLNAYQLMSTDRKTPFPDSVTIPEQKSGRLQLAAWLTHPDHPQTSRVMVNRIWQHLFGVGLVATPDDFGVSGARPSHPELLDYLANRFVDQGWSIKQLIREIVLTRTYQLDSRASQALVEVDPENVLLARHTRRRLEAEPLRDAMLFASGELDFTPGKGSNVENIDALIKKLFEAATQLHTKSSRRSLYLCLLRHSPPPELSAFDLPDGVAVAGRRNVTTLPTQSLFLFNNPFVIDQAEALATRVLNQETSSDTQRIQAIFQRTFQRNATSEEIEQANLYLQAIEHKLSTSNPRHKAWASLCQALLASNEFRYID